MNLHHFTLLAVVGLIGCSRTAPAPSPKPTPITTDLEELPAQTVSPPVVKDVDHAVIEALVTRDSVNYERELDDRFTHVILTATTIYSDGKRFPVALILVPIPPPGAGGIASPSFDGQGSVVQYKISNKPQLRVVG